MCDEHVKIVSIFLILLIVVCSAQPQKYRQRLTVKKLQPLKQRAAVPQRRVLARQEAVTPYPTADELKPDVPFEEGHIPDEVYGPPDETYGPPEIDQTPADQLPSEEAPKEFAFTPDVEEFQPSEEEPISRFIIKKKAIKKNILSRLVQKNKAKSLQRLVPLATKRYYISSQPFAYTAHYRTW